MSSRSQRHDDRGDEMKRANKGERESKGSDDGTASSGSSAVRRRGGSVRSPSALSVPPPQSPRADISRGGGASTPQAASEIEALQTRIADLVDEKKHSEQVLSALAEQNWHYLIDRSERIKAAFNSDMDSLISDIQALCAFSQQQKQLCTDYTPSRSRAHSTSNGRSAATNVDATVAPAESAGSMTVPTHVSAAAAAASSNGNGAKQKEFVWRDSHLTTLFRTSSDIQTVYNVFAAVLILFALKVWINDAFNSTRDEGSESGAASISLLLWNFGGVSRVVALWCAFFLTHCIMLPVMWAWRCGRIGDALYTGLYAAHQAAFLVGFGFAIERADLPVGSSMILLCEQVRMSMKAHSFWRETIRIKYHPSETPQGVQLHHSHSHANSTLIAHFPQQLKQFLLFHFVPTVGHHSHARLIYRNAYPRTRYIRWWFVRNCAIEVLGCIVYLYIIFVNFCVPEFKATAAHPGDLQALVVSLFNSVLPGIAVYLLAFFGLLHCWMNMFAELTRFADRQFYQDWWATTSFSSYYRKWNMIVHDSLYNYIYVDCLNHLHLPQGVCFFLTFFISAVVHEYIISLALKFFYPVLLVMFLGFGVFFVYLTRFLGTSGRAWNIFFWTNLIIGNGMLLIMYSREYYAHQPSHGSTAGLDFEYDKQSWLPYSWQPFVRSNQHVAITNATARV